MPIDIPDRDRLASLKAERDNAQAFGKPQSRLDAIDAEIGRIDRTYRPPSSIETTDAAGPVENADAPKARRGQ